MADLVSVIMPAYNAEKYIAEAIESVRSQTYPHWELIVVNDGSTDSTREIVEHFCEIDKRIKYLYQQNGKQGKARNLALAYCTGLYVAFLDADDLWFPEKLEVQLQELSLNQVDLVFSNYYTFNTNIADEKHLYKTNTGILVGTDAIKLFLERNRVPILTVLTRTALLNREGGFTEKSEIQNAEDYHLWLKLLFNGAAFYGSEKILALYREHEKSSTITDKLATNNVIEALTDLKHRYPKFEHLVNYHLKLWFHKYHYSTSKWKAALYQNLMYRNCLYTSNVKLYPLFKLSFKLFGLRLTRRLMNQFING